MDFAPITRWKRLSIITSVDYPSLRSRTNSAEEAPFHTSRLGQSRRSLTIPDPAHSQVEKRPVVLGQSHQGKMLLHLTTDPKLCDATVCWGAGAGEGCHGAALFDSPIPYSPDALDQIEAGLALLYEALSAALRNPPFANEVA